jgi:3-phosphoshikimate 1-carboxyvinyltransferase
MALPDLIEIVPPRQPLQGQVVVPGSKSITNRALVLAALAGGVTELRGALWSEDTQVMVDGLRRLGFGVSVMSDPAESGNRTITVEGRGGRIPGAGSTAQPLDLFVGNAGTAARFLAALVCLGHGTCRLHGVPRMHERPQAALFAALRQLGYRVDSPGDLLPATIHGTGPRHASCAVSVAESSQFASALLLAAGAGGWDVRIAGDNHEELPYVDMTRELARLFPAAGGEFQIEPDASSGSYFWGLNALPAGPGAHRVSVASWPTSGWQVDERFPQYLPLPGTVSRSRDLGDSIMTAIVLAPFAPAPVRFTELGRLRVQECERVRALRTELARCGATVQEDGDTLTVSPVSAPLHGAEVVTYHDHRMAMCFGILGLKVPGLRLQNPACVKKTFPNFFQKLAAPAPHGLGVEIRDGRSGRRLGVEELFAD